MDFARFQAKMSDANFEDYRHVREKVIMKFKLVLTLIFLFFLTACTSTRKYSSAEEANLKPRYKCAKLTLRGGENLHIFDLFICGDSLFYFDPATSDKQTIANSEIASIVTHHKTRGAVHGMFFGLAAGAAVGAAVGYIGTDNDSDEQIGGVSPLFFSTALFGAGGALVGLKAGSEIEAKSRIVIIDKGAVKKIEKDAVTMRISKR